MIKVKNLNVKLGKSHVLKDVDLQIDDNNNIVGLFGPNGAGKTTLINTITGFINRYQGTISDIDIGKIAYLPDKPFLYGFMTLDLAIKYFSDAFYDFDQNKAVRLFEQLNLTTDQNISQCSKGMMEQIHIILILCRNVDMYILDEPLAAVDPLTRDNIIHMIEKERHKNSMVLISTHLISDVEELFDEVIMIKNGRILLHENVDVLKDGNDKNLEEIFKERLR